MHAPTSIKQHCVNSESQTASIPIEKGRHLGTARDHRTCNKCDRNDIRDEYHTLFICKKYQMLRKDLLANHYYVNPSVAKMCELLMLLREKKLVKAKKNSLLHGPHRLNFLNFVFIFFLSELWFSDYSTEGIQTGVIFVDHQNQR